MHVGGYEADFVWRELMLIVEIDGDPWHRTAVDRAHDAERDRVHRALGYIVLRYSDEDVSERPAETLASLDSVLLRLSRGAGARGRSRAGRAQPGRSRRRSEADPNGLDQLLDRVVDRALGTRRLRVQLLYAFDICLMSAL